MHVIAAKAVAFKEAMEPEFVTYQKQVSVKRTGHGEGIYGSWLRCSFKRHGKPFVPRELY